MRSFLTLKANKYLIYYRLRLLCARIIARYDDKICIIGGNGAHYRTLRSVTISSAAKERDKSAVVIGPQCLQRVFKRVGRVGIVNNYRIVTVGRNKLHPALYTVSGFHCHSAVIKAYSQSQTDSNGVKCVIHRKFSRYGKAHIGALSVAGRRKAHALCGKPLFRRQNK